jgi:hypothetical protein
MVADLTQYNTLRNDKKLRKQQKAAESSSTNKQDGRRILFLCISPGYRAEFSRTNAATFTPNLWASCLSGLFSSAFVKVYDGHSRSSSLLSCFFSSTTPLAGKSISSAPIPVAIASFLYEAGCGQLSVISSVGIGHLPVPKSTPIPMPSIPKFPCCFSSSAKNDDGTCFSKLSEGTPRSNSKDLSVALFAGSFTTDGCFVLQLRATFLGVTSSEPEICVAVASVLAVPEDEGCITSLT